MPYGLSTYKEGGKQCTKDAIKNIGRLKSLDLVCLQEVITDLEGKIMKVQPILYIYIFIYIYEKNKKKF